MIADLELSPLLFSLLAISTVLFWVLLHRIKPYTLPPGPLGLPLLGHLPFLDPELHAYFARLAQSYGPIFSLRLGSKLAVVVSSPSLAKAVLKDNDVIFANRDVPAAARVSTYGGHDIAWSPYGAEWRMLRKVCVREVLGPAALDGVAGLRRREIRKTIGYLYSRVGSPVNIGEEMFITTLNVITSMLWRGTMKEEAERGSVRAEFQQVVAEMTALLGSPNVSDFYPSLARFDLQGIERRMAECVKRFDAIFESIIDKRLNTEEGVEENDFLQFLLKGENDSKMSMTHVKALLMDMVVGGTDTTSNTVEFAMAEVLSNPQVLTKAIQELDTVVPKSTPLEESHTSKLPYLHAIIQETLRLHPTLPLLVPRCPSEDCTVEGYTVPHGSRVFVNVWAIQRDPLVWPNPLAFDPDRFLGGKKYDYSGNEMSYFPFGSGRRMCAGVAMVERMLAYSLAALLHGFEWRLPEGEKIEVSEKFGIVLMKRNPLILIPSPRLSNPALYD